jgi:hypothetical protein
MKMRRKKGFFVRWNRKHPSFVRNEHPKGHDDEEDDSEDDDSDSGDEENEEGDDDEDDDEEDEDDEEDDDSDDENSKTDQRSQCKSETHPESEEVHQSAHEAMEEAVAERPPGFWGQEPVTNNAPELSEERKVDRGASSTDGPSFFKFLEVSLQAIATPTKLPKK